LLSNYRQQSSDQTITPQRRLYPTRRLLDTTPLITTANMSADLVNILLSFQPESPELKQKLEYDQQARSFVAQLSNISASHWQKGADTPQDVLEVSAYHEMLDTSLTTLDTEPRGQLNSLRLRPPPAHPCHRREAQCSRHTQTRGRVMDQIGALAGDIRPCADAICGT
jgi:hypothetical protein